MPWIRPGSANFTTGPASTAGSAGGHTPLGPLLANSAMTDSIRPATPSSRSKVASTKATSPNQAGTPDISKNSVTSSRTSWSRP